MFKYVVGGALIIILAAVTGCSKQVEPSPVPSIPSPSPTVAIPTPDPSVTTSAEQAEPVAIPQCADLYSDSFKAKMKQEGGLVIWNSERYQNWDLVNRGTKDAVLEKLISEGSPEVTCVWNVDRDQPEYHVGIVTNVTRVSADQEAAAKSRLAELGKTSSDAFGGTWIVFENPMDGEGDDLPSGESHFFRDGLWFATFWLSYGPDGYTEEMANQTFNSIG